MKHSVDENQNPSDDGKGHLRPAEADGQSGVVGRELDAQIADSVMGWKRVRSDRDIGDDRKDVAWMLHKSRVLKGEPYTYASMDGLHDRMFAKWSPSTDIAAAMEVVEKMLADGFNVEIRRHQNLDAWYAEFSKIEDDEMRPSGNDISDTLPEAICRASLQATDTSASDGTTVQIR